jgi:trigger factor
MSFTVTTEPRENRQLAVTIAVSSERVDQELRKAAAKLASQYRIPGFRKGKAPYHIVVQQIGLPNLYSEFIDELGQELFREAIVLEKIEPYAQSSLENIQLEPLTYQMVVPLEPEVKLGDYRSLRVEEDPVAIDPVAVEERIKRYQGEYSSWQEVTRPAQYQDLLSVNVRSVIAPEQEGAEETVVLDEENWEITLDEANPMEPAGFDRELLGMCSSEEKQFVVKWPENTKSIYAGKEAHFQVRVNSVKAYERPELNDAFAQMVGPDFQTMADLEHSIEESLGEETRKNSQDRYLNKVLDTLIEKSELNYPPVVVEDQLDSMLQTLERNLRRYGIENLESFLRQSHQNPDEYREQMRPEAVKQAQRNLILSEVIKQEGIEATAEEIEQHLRQLLGVSPGEEIPEQAAATATMLRVGAGRNMIVSQILVEKASTFLQTVARTSDTAASDTAASDTAASDTAASDTAASDTD